MSFFDRFKKKQTKERLASIGKGVEPTATKEVEREKPKESKKNDAKKEGKATEKEPQVQKPSHKKEPSATAHKVLFYPLITEKATTLHAGNQYSFAVDIHATKQQIRQAIAELYGVTPISVNVQRYDGTWVTFGRHIGRTKRWKKAIVSLKDGDSITITEAA